MMFPFLFRSRKLHLKEVDAEKLISFLKEMEFKTLTEKKSKQLNIDSDNIKASDQVEKFEKK